MGGGVGMGKRILECYDFWVICDKEKLFKRGGMGWRVFGKFGIYWGC